METEKKMETKPPLLYKLVDGYKFPTFFPSENFRLVNQYKPRKGDIFIVTQPKCGSNWTQYILFLILHQGNPPKDGIEFGKDTLFVDLMGMDMVEKMPRPAVFKTHLTYDVAPKSPDAKYIYVARNPKDCSVSHYHMVLSLYPDTNIKTFDEFFELFYAGEKDYGEFFDHVLSWYEHRHEPNVLFLTYEQMKADPRKWIGKIIEFLGDEWATMYREHPEMLDKVIEYSGVSYMKKHAKSAAEAFLESPNQDKILNDPNIPLGVKSYLIRCRNMNRVFKVVRKGVVGDWRSYYTTEQNRRMDAKLEERLEGTELLELWRSMGCI